MSNEPLLLARPEDSPDEDDYRAFCAALEASGRGRGFLAEYARRNRQADTAVLLTALDRIEARLTADGAALARLRDELRLPIIYVSHAMEEIVRLADTLVLLSAGKVAAAGSVEELTSRLDLRPLTGRYEAGAVIRTSVAGHDAAYGLTELAFPGGKLRISHVALPLGTPVRVRVRARDVALARTRPADISIRNILPARIIEIAPDRDARVDLKLDIGTPQEPVALWARVTHRAAQELGLAVGQPIFALLKTVALDRASLGRHEPQPGDPGGEDSL